MQTTISRAHIRSPREILREEKKNDFQFESDIDGEVIQN